MEFGSGEFRANAAAEAAANRSLPAIPQQPAEVLSNPESRFPGGNHP
jgi:hypothetical protein